MFKNGVIVVIVLTLVLLGFANIFLQPPEPPASQAFINANVITMDSTNSVAQAVLLSGNMITAVGSNEEISNQITKQTRVYNLHGNTLIPGFIDAHGHFPGSGLAQFSVDLNSPPIGDITRMADLLDKLKQQGPATENQGWILGAGYDDTLLAEKRHPTLYELDQLFPKQPVFIMHISGHMGVANSAAMARGNIDRNTPSPPGGTIVKNLTTGQLTGLLEENAMVGIRTMAMDFSTLDFFAMIQAAGAEYVAKGVTTAQSGLIDSLEIAQGLKLAQQLNMIPLRLEVWPTFDGLGALLLDGQIKKENLESGSLNIGAIKITADGSIQGYTGYLSEPYHTPYHGDRNYNGYPRVSNRDLFRWIEKYHIGGYQIAIHGNGDASIDDILDAIENAQRQHPRKDSRHIIVHAQMARDDQLDRMKNLGVTPSFFVAHTYYWGDRHRELFLGPERAARISPAASALAKKLPFTIHLDAPVVPMDPLFLVWTAVNRLSSSGAIIGPDERISALQALRAVTIDAAWQIHQEDNRGSIEVGKLADLVVLSDDPLTSDIPIKDIEVQRTLVGGITLWPSAR